MKLPISSIIIKRDERQRRELTGIEELAASLSNVGLINPVVINSDNELIAGERRLTAAISLGWTEIAVTLLSDLDPVTAHIIELEENIKRCDLPWQDEVRAIATYHSMRLQQDASHTVVRTAKELALSERKVRHDLLIHSEMEQGNDLVLEAPQYSTARNIAERRAERVAAQVSDDIAATILGPAPVPAPTLSDITTGEGWSAPSGDAPPAPILLADFNEWASTYAGPRFNFLHCDFPYGIKADKHNQGAAKLFRGYVDNPETYWELIATLGDAMSNVVSDSAHLMFWFSMNYYEATFLALTQIGWRVNPMPLVWFKSDNTGILPDPNRGPRQVYETAFIASRGDRKIVQPVANLFAAPPDASRIHMSQKSIPMLQHFFRMFVDDTTLLLDPTCGSGSALHAGAHAQQVLGLEKLPDFHASAVELWNSRKEIKL